jgi:hypothetical protein
MEASRVRELKARGMRPDIAKALKIGRASSTRYSGRTALKARSQMEGNDECIVQ